MSRNRPAMLTAAAVAAACLGYLLPAQAEDAPPPKPDTPAQPPAQAPAKASKPMKMNQPMAGEMKKDGTMKGDVKKAAEEKDREMKPMMEKEEKSMKK